MRGESGPEGTAVSPIRGAAEGEQDMWKGRWPGVECGVVRSQEELPEETRMLLLDGAS